MPKNKETKYIMVVENGQVVIRPLPPNIKVIRDPNTILNQNEVSKPVIQISASHRTRLE